VSRYYVDKFLYRVDRDQQALAAYMADPVAFVTSWETGDGLRLHDGEHSTGLGFTDQERTALQQRDYRTLYQLGAHPFILFTLMIAVYAPEYDEFIAFAHDYRDRIAALGHPDYST
jgi:hypothetical protein